MSGLPNDLAEVFEYLDELRVSGESNMFGAGAYVAAEFCMDRRQASAATVAWMKTFDGKTSPEDRAAKAREQGL